MAFTSQCFGGLETPALETVLSSVQGSSREVPLQGKDAGNPKTWMFRKSSCSIGPVLHYNGNLEFMVNKLRELNTG